MRRSKTEGLMEMRDCEQGEERDYVEGLRIRVRGTEI
jgi:hypothetical protein